MIDLHYKSNKGVLTEVVIRLTFPLKYSDRVGQAGRVYIHTYKKVVKVAPPRPEVVQTELPSSLTAAVTLNHLPGNGNSKSLFSSFHPGPLAAP